MGLVGVVATVRLALCSVVFNGAGTFEARAT
jgi:hypothetical protein